MLKEKRAINVKVLVVDDSQEAIELIERQLKSSHYQTYACNNVQSAIKILETVQIDLVITAVKMRGGNGIDLVRHVSANYKDIGILVVTGFPSIRDAVQSIKSGAEEYLVKSFTGDELFRSVESVLVKKQRQNRNHRHDLTQTFGIIGESEGMLRVFDRINKARTTDATVLITGESGTGKELVARALHYGGKTSAAPFVAVNCGGIPDSLLESELFGHKKGSFTGATETRAGFFQTANGGTIFLDEISNTSLAMQAKLLRVLQEKEFYMTGSKQSLKVNLRIVAATNVDLMQLVKRGLFREDLYYRLNIISISIPPLRERGNDIFQLIDFFLNKFVGDLGKEPMNFTSKALGALKEYGWPGNVRELQNLIHRSVIMADETTIDMPDLPEPLRYSARRTRGLDRKLQQVEREYIIDALAANKNNISQTAIRLGINRKTLRDKISKYTTQGERKYRQNQ